MGHDSVWVVVDHLIKTTHFIAIHTSFTSSQLAQKFIHEIIWYHGVPISIISDQGSIFTSQYWGSFHEALGMQLALSTTFHPQMDGQLERTIQILEDMLRACALDFKGSWEKNLPYVEFTYNNSYQSSIQIVPYEALYGRRCRSPLGWFEVGERRLIGPDLVSQSMEIV